VVYGLTGMGLAIMLHSMYFHKRHRENFQIEENAEDDSESTLRQDRLG
jgi:hypothetical protein